MICHGRQTVVQAIGLQARVEENFAIRSAFIASSLSQIR